jgi:hypothetical protein
VENGVGFTCSRQILIAKYWLLQVNGSKIWVWYCSQLPYQKSLKTVGIKLCRGSFENVNFWQKKMHQTCTRALPGLKMSKFSIFAKIQYKIMIGPHTKS